MVDLKLGERRANVTGRARVPVEARRVRVSVALPRAVWSDVTTAAALHGVSRSQVVAAVLMSSGFDGPGVADMVERVERLASRGRI